MNNWVKLSRDLRGSFDKNPMKDFKLMNVYQYLLEKANWEDSDVLKRGQVRISSENISLAVPVMMRHQVDTALDGLVRLGRLSIEKTSGTKMFGRVATILDYGMQDDDISTYDLKNRNESVMNPESLALESLDKLPVCRNESVMNPESTTKEVKKKRNKDKQPELVRGLETSAIDIALELAELWNATMSTCPKVSIKHLSDDRKGNVLKVIQKAKLSVDEVKDVIRSLKSDNWLCDEYKPNFDWLFSKNKERRVLNLVLRYEKFLSMKKPKPEERYLT
jgi:hypothetical protein